MTTVLKLGGSLITDKTQEEVVARENLDRVCDAIATAGLDDLVLVHGGGSFGHRAASEHGITTTSGTRDVRATRSVTRAMDRLNTAVVDALHAVDVPALTVPPRAMAVKDDAGDLRLAPMAVRAHLAEGMIPVLHGDMVAHDAHGATVVSGDALAVELCAILPGDRIGFCAGVPGVLDRDGSVIPSVSSYADVDGVLDDPDGADVSGGMATKVRSLLNQENPGAIFGIDDLPAFLDGGCPGTTVNTRDTGPF